MTHWLSRTLAWYTRQTMDHSRFTTLRRWSAPPTPSQDPQSSASKRSGKLKSIRRYSCQNMKTGLFDALKWESAETACSTTDHSEYWKLKRLLVVTRINERLKTAKETVESGVVEQWRVHFRHYIAGSKMTKKWNGSIFVGRQKCVKKVLAIINVCESFWILTYGEKIGLRFHR